MEVHIGKIIKGKLDHKKISITEFSKQINCTRRNVYKIFEKPSIDTELLVRISKVIGENLFISYLSKEEIANYAKRTVSSVKLMNAIRELQAAMTVDYENKKKEDLLKRKRRELKERNKLKNKRFDM